MIPIAAITAWSGVFPWANQHYIEQDLVLCRTLTELFNDPMLSTRLAFRGGTAIHKLYLSPQPRYSDDIDLVQISPEPIGAVLDRIREACSFLGTPAVKQSSSNNTMVYRFISETLPQAKLRIKIEINCKEHVSVLGLVAVPFEVRNPWYTGNCSIATYSMEELIGTKIRALYQRKKGRDLFDIYYALASGKLDVNKTMFCYSRYMELSQGCAPQRKAYLENLAAKMRSPSFRADMDFLLRPGVRYDINEAFSLFREHCIEAM